MQYLCQIIQKTAKCFKKSRLWN